RTAPGPHLPMLPALPTRVALLDPTGTVLATNAAWRDHGLAAGRFIGATAGPGDNYLDACAARADEFESADVITAGLRAVLAGVTTTLELDYARGDGTSRRWWRVLALPDGPASGGGTVVLHTDITAIKAAEAAVAQREAQLQSILDTVPDAMVVIDERGIV